MRQVEGGEGPSAAFNSWDVLPDWAHRGGVWGGEAPPTAFNSWVVLPDWEHLPKMSILRFCHERGQIKRWGAVRHVIVSGISMRVFFIFIFSHKKSVFRHLCVSCVFDVFLRFFKNKNVPKVPQKCLGGVWDILGPSPTHSGQLSTHFGPKPHKNKCYNNYIKNPL